MGLVFLGYFYIQEDEKVCALLQKMTNKKKKKKNDDNQSQGVTHFGVHSQNLVEYQLRQKIVRKNIIWMTSGYM